MGISIVKMRVGSGEENGRITSQQQQQLICALQEPCSRNIKENKQSVFLCGCPNWMLVYCYTQALSHMLLCGIEYIHVHLRPPPPTHEPSACSVLLGWNSEMMVALPLFYGFSNGSRRELEMRISGSWEIVDVAIKAQNWVVVLRLKSASPTTRRIVTTTTTIRSVHQCELTGNEEQFRNQQSLFQIGKLTRRTSSRSGERWAGWSSKGADMKWRKSRNDRSMKRWMDFRKRSCMKEQINRNQSCCNGWGGAELRIERIRFNGF